MREFGKAHFLLKSTIAVFLFDSSSSIVMEVLVLIFC